MPMQGLSTWDGATGGTQDTYPKFLAKAKNNFNILSQGMDFDTVRYRDDFNSDTLDAGWNVVEGTDAATSVHTLDPNDANGILTFTTGDAGTGFAADAIQITRDLHWNAAAGGLTFEARFSLSAITTCYCFFGLTDVVTLEAPIESAASADTFTSNATDAVGVMFDTRMATDNWWLTGVATDVDAVHANSGFAPVAATFETWRVDVTAAGVATFYRNHVLVASLAAAVTAAAMLTPTFAVSKTSVAASMTANLDYIGVAKKRV